MISGSSSLNRLPHELWWQDFAPCGFAVPSGNATAMTGLQDGHTYTAPVSEPGIRWAFVVAGSVSDALLLLDGAGRQRSLLGGVPRRKPT